MSGIAAFRWLAGLVPVLALGLAAWQAVEIHELRDQVAHLQSERDTIFVATSAPSDDQLWVYPDDSTDLFQLVSTRPGSPRTRRAP